MTEIRSYRTVFELERRIYRIDRLRLNPGGVPVRGVGYFLAALFVVVLIARVPLVGSVVHATPWYLRDLALPGILAAAFCVVRLEGRPFHVAAIALLRYQAAAHRGVGVRGRSASEGVWRPQDVVLLPDGSDARMRAIRYTGPGTVRVTVEHHRGGWATDSSAPGPARRSLRPALTLTETRGGVALESAQVLVLAAGVRVSVRSGAPDEQGRR